MDVTTISRPIGKTKGGGNDQSYSGGEKVKKNELKPWRVRSWCIPRASARFVANMEDVLSVYQRPYDEQKPQVCLDESHKHLRSIPRGAISVAPGQSRREDYEYQRHGQCAIFMAVEPLAGQRHVWVRERRTKLDCAEVLRELVEVIYPHAATIVLVVDNLNTHHAACLYERFPADEARRIAARLEWHYTPRHGSWLNIAEIELSALRRQCLKAKMSDINYVRRQVEVWQSDRNQLHTKVDWRFTTDDARIKLKRLYPIVKVQ